MDQLVILKGQRDGIAIILDADADFALIEEALRQRVQGARHFFEGANTTLSFKGRKLSEAEEQSLLEIILSETTLDIAFVESDGFKRPMPVMTTTNPALESSPIGISYTEGDTAFYRNGIRSGQSIRYHGSVIIMGDANAGSEIIADGNVVVLGALKGMAHAGAMGDDTCYIAALQLRPTQLRIGKVIIDIPESTKKGNVSPECVYIENGQVLIAPLV